MLSIIAAINENYVIGKDNKLPWHISEDLKRFKKLTTGKTIIMGRKTFESLPSVLPNRKHIVITNNINYNYDNDNVEVVHRINDVLKYKNCEDEVFIIGGGKVYAEFLPYCEKLYLTKVHSNQGGDTFFPKFDINNYEIIENEKNDSGNIKYSFLTLKLKYHI
ncbi:dihydrofolate reductase [Clostridium neuense]|uniref:Dihydrofolate reductase n=1 Tax=Clostridium neuense TaxID=1728934 RepID=A0ABW8TB39_9CLOT